MKKFAEGWSDDPGNDDYKMNPDGTFMRDKNGRKIAKGFSDDFDELKERFAAASGRVKEKILALLGLDNPESEFSFNENTKVTLTIGQIKQLIKEAKSSSAPTDSEVADND